MPVTASNCTKQHDPGKILNNCHETAASQLVVGTAALTNSQQVYVYLFTSSLSNMDREHNYIHIKDMTVLEQRAWGDREEIN